jgi:hypothetical protein
VSEVNEEKLPFDPNARVKANMKFVRNLGKFESLHIDLGVERDVPDGIPYLKALRMLRKEVEGELEVAIKEVDEDRAQNRE